MAGVNRKDLTGKEILSILREHQDILKRCKVKRIGIFGSYVRGEQKKRSDIDLLVEFDETAFDRNFTGYFDNYEELSSFLRKILGRKIDLLTEEAISPYIKPYVLREVEYCETS